MFREDQVKNTRWFLFLFLILSFLTGIFVGRCFPRGPSYLNDKFEIEGEATQDGCEEVFDSEGNPVTCI
jgi:hypothetical protein